VQDTHQWEVHLWWYFSDEIFEVIEGHLPLASEYLCCELFKFLLLRYSIFVLYIFSLILIIQTLLRSDAELGHCVGHLLEGVSLKVASSEWHIGQHNSHIFLRNVIIAVKIIPIHQLSTSYSTQLLLLSCNISYILNVSLNLVSKSLIKTLTKLLMNELSFIKPSLWLSKMLKSLSLMIPGSWQY